MRKNYDEYSDSKTWFVATDGSENSRLGFDQCLKEFYKDNDNLIICSIKDKSKTYLPHSFQPDTIYNDYRAYLLSHFHSSKYEILMEEKDSSLSIKDQLLQEAARKYAFAIFIGFSGRKGAKADATLMGSTLRHAAVRTSVPIFITKRLQTREKTNTGGFTFLVCLDGSQRSKQGMALAAGLATESRDQVLMCTVGDGEVAKQVRGWCSDFYKQVPVKGELLVLDSTNMRGEAIVDFVNRDEKYDVNYVVFAKSGLRAERESGDASLGSVAEYLIANLKTNIILLP